MLYSINTLKGYKIQAKDGQIGKLDEVYFDDGCWRIRYLVVDVGNLLKRQQVLLIPEAVAGINPAASTIEVNLTKKEVEKSPDALEVTPVSREREIALHHHHDWTPYWVVDPLGSAGFGRSPDSIVRAGRHVRAKVDLPNDATSFADPQVRERAADSETADVETAPPVSLRPSGRLQSSRELIGYHIQAKDGEIGRLDDFLVDRDFQAINFLLVYIGNWLHDKKIVILPHFVHNIQWKGAKKVQVMLPKIQIENAIEYESVDEPTHH